MSGWLTRGIGLALVIVLARALLGFAISEWPLHGSTLRILALVAVVLVPALFGLLDGRRDRSRNPDPETGADLTMIWLKAAVLGGLVSGALAWIVDQAPKLDLGDNPLLFEMTSGAAFVVLLIFVPAMIGVAVGRWLAGRKNRTPRKEQEPRKKDRTKDREKTKDRDKKSRFRSKSKAAAATPVAVGASPAGSEPVPEPSQGYFADDSYSYDTEQSHEPQPLRDAQSNEYGNTADQRTQTWQAPPERR